jgi:hypothetical protein
MTTPIVIARREWSEGLGNPSWLRGDEWIIELAY